jgi:predicted peroxiredoxin
MAKMVVSITHAADDVDRATVGMVVANAAAASGVETIVFLSSEGAHLGKRGFADDLHEEGFKPLAELIADFQTGGGQFWVCSPCFKKRGYGEADLIASSTIVGGAKLVEALVAGASCVSY